MEQKKINLIFLIVLALGLSGFFVFAYVVKSITLTQFLISLGLVLLVFVFRLYRILKMKPVDILSKKDLLNISKNVLKAIGGPDNLIDITACVTRVKLKVVDSTKIEAADLRNLGISGVIKPSNTEIHLITKEHTQNLHESLKKIVGQRNGSL